MKIKNDWQYRHTKGELKRLRAALKAFDYAPAAHPGLHPRLIQAQRDGLQSQIATLAAEVKTYERLRQKKPRLRELALLYKLPELLIQARVSKGLSHEKLGELTGLKKQQIQRYEQTDYASASLTRLVEIARAIETCEPNPAR
jgi:ribosome-binding protein aMBF1 (putative translation factor)